jgi:hypothetical protein
MMFEHLSDPNPPMPGPDQRAAVRERATRIRRRHRAVQSVVIVTAAAVLFTGLFAGTRRSSDEPIDVLTPSGDCCGSISGTVRGDQAGLKDVNVYLMYTEPDGAPATSLEPSGHPSARNPWRIKKQLLTDAAGHYAFGDLQPGRYILRFADHYDEIKRAFLYQPVFYGDAEVFSKAKPVEVTTGRDTVVDVTMRRSANWAIKGQVQLAGVANPFPIAKVSVRLFVDGELAREVLTDEDGVYNLGGVDAGQYTIAFVDLKKGIYATTWAEGGKPVVMPNDRDLVVNARMVSCPESPTDPPVEGCD